MRVIYLLHWSSKNTSIEVEFSGKKIINQHFSSQKSSKGYQKRNACVWDSRLAKKICKKNRIVVLRPSICMELTGWMQQEPNFKTDLIVFRLRTVRELWRRTDSNREALRFVLRLLGTEMETSVNRVECTFRLGSKLDHCVTRVHF